MTCYLAKECDSEGQIVSWLQLERERVEIQGKMCFMSAIRLVQHQNFSVYSMAHSPMIKKQNLGGPGGGAPVTRCKGPGSGPWSLSAMGKLHKW